MERGRIFGTRFPPLVLILLLAALTLGGCGLFGGDDAPEATATPAPAETAEAPQAGAADGGPALALGSTPAPAETATLNGAGAQPGNTTVKTGTQTPPGTDAGSAAAPGSTCRVDDSGCTP